MTKRTITLSEPEHALLCSLIWRAMEYESIVDFMLAEAAALPGFDDDEDGIRAGVILDEMLHNVTGDGK